MQLSWLRVAHWNKSHAFANPLTRDQVFSYLSGAFVIETCQRRIWVFADECSLLPSGKELLPIEVYSGEDAYQFILRVACGLESQIAGETDVFGQIKEAWKKFSSDRTGLSQDLSPWMQRVFEDTKEIRARYLENIGGASYGSLARRVLRDQGLQAGQSIWMLGAGQLAQSVCPLLTDYEIRLHNRTLRTAWDLSVDLLRKVPARVLVLSQEQWQNEWSRADFVVLCTPWDEEKDPERLQSFQGKALIHLGARKTDCGKWGERPEIFCLDQLFQLQEKQDQARLGQIKRAAKACEERASLRSLSSFAGGSVSLPHGWEDLAIFA